MCVCVCGLKQIRLFCDSVTGGVLQGTTYMLNVVGPFYIQLLVGDILCKYIIVRSRPSHILRVATSDYFVVATIIVSVIGCSKFDTDFFYICVTVDKFSVQ